MNRNQTLFVSLLLAVWVIPMQANAQYHVESAPEAVEVRGPDGTPIATYCRVVPENIELTVESGGFFHPFNTPSGTTVTGLRPEDHLYHRGIFFAWFEMLGDVPADFWGWGQHAPTEGRRIASRAIPRVAIGPEGVEFTAENAWLIEDTAMVDETLEARVWQEDQANIMDLTYTVVPATDITLPRRAFSGFCFRTRIDGEIRAFNQQGEVDLASPSHVDPESNWPSEPWYAYEIRLEDKEAPVGAAVIDHPDNPESLWHNPTAIGMLNPVIMAQEDVHLPAQEPFVLRYRVVAFDGETPTALLDRLYNAW